MKLFEINIEEVIRKLIKYLQDDKLQQNKTFSGLISQINDYNKMIQDIYNIGFLQQFQAYIERKFAKYQNNNVEAFIDSLIWDLVIYQQRIQDTPKELGVLMHKKYRNQNIQKVFVIQETPYINIIIQRLQEINQNLVIYCLNENKSQYVKINYEKLPFILRDVDIILCEAKVCFSNGNTICPSGTQLVSIVLQKFNKKLTVVTPTWIIRKEFSFNQRNTEELGYEDDMIQHLSVETFVTEIGLFNDVQISDFAEDIFQ